MTLTKPARRSAFADIPVPTRYAPGHTPVPYQLYTGDPDTWVPVIYYPLVDDRKVWLVEPYPAGRADGTDGLDPITEAGVAVLRGAAAPRPRVLGDPDGDWLVPGLAKAAEAAYDVHVTDRTDLMAAWCQAHAIATALNNGTVALFGLEPNDLDVLFAAAGIDLIRDTSKVGLDREYTRGACGVGEYERLPVEKWRVDRLTGGPRPFVDAYFIRDLDGGGAQIRYGLGPRGTIAVREIRKQYDGPARCSRCGCTEDRGMPPVSWSGPVSGRCSECGA